MRLAAVVASLALGSVLALTLVARAAGHEETGIAALERRVDQRVDLHVKSMLPRLAVLKTKSRRG